MAVRDVKIQRAGHTKEGFENEFNASLAAPFIQIYGWNIFLRTGEEATRGATEKRKWFLLQHTYIQSLYSSTCCIYTVIILNGVVLLLIFLLEFFFPSLQQT
jgi:hypothetical protein